MATGKKEKFRTINTPDFISSEEDDVDALGRIPVDMRRGPMPRQIRTLQWESEDLTH